MESSGVCKSCRARTLVPDYDTGNTVCSSCGTVQAYDNYQDAFGGINGPVGSFVRVGTAGTGGVCNYKEKKVYEANKVIDNLTLKLGFSGSHEVRNMVQYITEGEFGEGNWFPIFVGACAYVVMRRDNKSLPIVEVAAVIGCDVHELGRMVARVVDNLRLKLPEFDIVSAFERVIHNNPRFSSVSRNKTRMLKQGIFLLQCSVKWFLTTGRRPLPMVAAVLVFVAKLNQVDACIEDVAKELHVVLSTVRSRYKELLETLVKVAQGLPWGKDVTVKNILKNAPHVIQYMELKSMSKQGEKKRGLDYVGFDLDDMVSDITSKEIEYGTDNCCLRNDGQYFEARNSSSLSIDELDKFQISPECLSVIYSKFADEVPHVEAGGERGEENQRKSGRNYVHHVGKEWWKGKSELSKKLFLKQILEKDVGLNAMPPSFVSGCLEYQRRREKIKAAKLRIDNVMRPPVPDSGDGGNSLFTKCVNNGKKRRKMQVDIDSEDFIIETLLLHQVEEGEIEKGHYTALLDLHVFNSGSL